MTPQGHPYSNLVHEPTMVDLFSANAAALGRDLRRETPEDALKAGSTDMGNVSNMVASIHPFIGMDTDGAVNHQPEFAAHTITAEGERALRDGAVAMAWTVIDLAAGDHWENLKQPG